MKNSILALTIFVLMQDGGMMWYKTATHAYLTQDQKQYMVFEDMNEWGALEFLFKFPSKGVKYIGNVEPSKLGIKR